MQQDAINVSTKAIETYSIEKDIACYIKKEFDRKHNPTWHCVVGIIILNCKVEISDLMLLMKQNTSFISTWDKLPYYCSNQVDFKLFNIYKFLNKYFINFSFKFIPL